MTTWIKWLTNTLSWCHHIIVRHYIGQLQPVRWHTRQAIVMDQCLWIYSPSRAVFITGSSFRILGWAQNFKRSIRKFTFLCILLCIFNFGHCKLQFSSIILHVRNALKSQYLFVVSAKLFPASQSARYQCLRCAFQIFHICTSSVCSYTIPMS